MFFIKWTLSLLRRWRFFFLVFQSCMLFQVVGCMSSGMKLVCKHFDSSVHSLLTWSALFQKNFGPAGSYCLTNVCSTALNALFSTVSTESISFARQRVTTSLHCFHSSLSCLYFWQKSQKWLVGPYMFFQVQLCVMALAVNCILQDDATQIIMQICYLSTFCTDYKSSNPAHHFRRVSWLSSFIRPKPKVLPDRRSGAFFIEVCRLHY